VAHLVTHQRALGRQFAAPRHLEKSSSIPASRQQSAACAGVKIMSISRNRGRIGRGVLSVKVLALGKRAEKPVWKPFQRVKDHIKGAIPADINLPGL
jgi:hypothetical protein